MQGRARLKAALAAAVILGAASAGYAQTVSMTPALKALAAAADKEGTLVFQGSTSSWAGPTASS